MSFLTPYVPNQPKYTLVMMPSPTIITITAHEPSYSRRRNEKFGIIQWNPRYLLILIGVMIFINGINGINLIRNGKYYYFMDVFHGILMVNIMTIWIITGCLVGIYGKNIFIKYSFIHGMNNKKCTCYHIYSCK